ncbi:MAG: hypothetical protein H7296_05475 [Bacteroidia bacterium]|nr:hypothetical protein [Bacteroidia bacterium]
MKNKNEEANELENKFPGYPPYPVSEDIYNTNEKVSEVDPEDSSSIKKNPEDKEVGGDLLTGEDLDVPGAELDDNNEDIGNEDEENNYYSLGGDNHDDLEEDRITYPKL